jgi:hypothetical protein
VGVPVGTRVVEHLHLGSVPVEGADDRGGTCGLLREPSLRNALAPRCSRSGFRATQRGDPVVVRGGLPGAGEFEAANFVEAALARGTR